MSLLIDVTDQTITNKVLLFLGGKEWKQKKQFDFLVKDNGLKYVYQEFYNCYGGNWRVYTHSYYNQSGCFTIHTLPQRGELDFYYAKEFSTVLENLCELLIDISSIEKEIWDKHNKILFFRNPFFWWSRNKVLKALAEVIRQKLIKKMNFLGLKSKFSNRNVLWKL